MASGIKLVKFGGIAPRIASELLPPDYGQVAHNVKLSSGDLVPYRAPEALITAPLPSPLTIYPFVALGSYYWAMWQIDVDVIQSPNATLLTQRYYYTGETEPRATDLNRATFYDTVVKTSGYTQLSTDHEKTIQFTAAATYGLLAAATAGNQFVVVVYNSSAGTVTIDPSGAELIDGAATVTVAAGVKRLIRCSGTAWTSEVVTRYPYDYFTLGLPTPAAAPVINFDILAKAAGYTAVAGDSGKTIDCTATPWTLALTTAPTLGSSWIVVVRNLGTGDLTIDPAGAELINGAATITVKSGEVGVITCNATSFTGTILVGSFKSYVYTWVSNWGEESAPSSPSNLLLLTSGQRVTVSSLPSAPPAGRYNITSYNIYRTNTGSSGTSYQFVATQSISATTTYTDSVTDTALGAAIESTFYTSPPTDLAGITNMANGMTAAFHGNEVCFSEPYTPHAWPSAYRYSVDSPIVAIAGLGNSLIITTEGRPYVATGNHPASVSVYPIDMPYPCLSKRALVNIGTGIVYPTYQGLVLISGVSPQLATAQLFTRDEWTSYNPTTMAAEFYDNKYVANYTDTSAGTSTLIFSTQAGEPPVFSTNQIWGSACFSDPQTGVLYFVREGTLYRWDSPNSEGLVARWKSKDFVLAKPVNMGVAKIYCDYLPTLTDELANAAIVARNAALDERGYLGGPSFGEFEIAGDAYEPLVDAGANYVTFLLYTDKVLRFSRRVYSTAPFRLPTGYKSDTLSVEIQSNYRVHAILLAETPAELEKLDAA